jgi:tRNA modification GTPase
MEALADADLVLVVLDASEGPTKEDEELLAPVEQRPAIVVENKCDLRGNKPSASANIPTSGKTGQKWGTPVSTSALTGVGLTELRSEILKHIGGETGLQESGFVTNVRHAGLIKDSLAALSAADMAVAGRVPHEMLLLDLYNVLRPLDAITGATTTDDILNLIFSTFCIGK